MNGNGGGGGGGGEHLERLREIIAESLYGPNVATAVARGVLPEPEEYARATVLFLDVVDFARCAGWGGEELRRPNAVTWGLKHTGPPRFAAWMLSAQITEW
jgi:hypothetical protein